MNAKTLKKQLTDSDVILIMKTLGGVIWDENDEQIIYNTICHDGNSVNKLYYYKRINYENYDGENNFYCYTGCGSIDIFHIVQHVKDYDLTQSINYVCTLLGISDLKYGFTDERIETINDWDFINSYTSKYNKLNKTQNSLKIINKNKLNMFQNIYTTEWLLDGIGDDVMKEFCISYSTLNQSIIIPHFDIDNNLIGIRQRSLLEDDVKNYGKYTPFSICGQMFNHKLNLNLYGIHKNKNIIKQKKKVMLVESEKGVLQSASMFGLENNFTLALCGCTQLSNYQINLLLSLEIDEVIIALDKQYEDVTSDKYIIWQKHIREKIINPILPYFKVYVLWDTENLLEYKDSPTDKGKDVLLKLMKNKIYIK